MCIRDRYHSDQDHLSKPILVAVSDGGPDHRVTFGSVKVASLTLFRALDLDMLICIRTCPYQSWTNVAERVMSTLNLALQNVSLARTAMADRFERLVKNKNSLADVREAIKMNTDLGPALLDSMSAPTCGSPLFAGESDSIVVREALVCSNPIEAQYYSSKLAHFPPVCYHCGLGEESLANNSEIQEMLCHCVTHMLLVFT